MADRVLYMVRHGVAIGRDEWAGPEAERPLVGRGWQQAVALMDYLDGRGAQHFVSSPTVRCRDMLVPAAHRAGATVRDEDLLGDCRGLAIGEAVLRTRMRRVLRICAQLAPGPVVACTHGETIPLLLAEAGVAARPPCPKGGVWELRLDEVGDVTAATYRGRPGEG